jgi:glycosyltransferase involved in cell wall biosynthesis
MGRWLNVVSHLDPKYGGVSAVVPQLASAVAGVGGFAVGIDAFCSSGEEFSPSLHRDVTLRYWPNAKTRWITDRALNSSFADAIRDADGVHIHGLWDQSTRIAAAVARRLNKPYIVSAHGMLERWALNNKKLKKQIYSALVERANIEGAACLHALTQAEAEDYRRYGSRRPIAVIPNGVRIPLQVGPKTFLEKYPELKGKRILLFLGRLHFKKGVDLLVKAYAQLRTRWPESTLVLAGPDSENSRASIEKLVSDLGIGSQVVFTGMLDSELKWSALAASEGFVLPSYSEGLSVSTLEAMGMGLPVIVTRQCNLPEVVACGGGWQIEPDVDELAGSIKELFENSKKANHEIGNNCLKLVRERYNWPFVGAMMGEVYRWLQSGVNPQNVEIQII